MAHVRTRHPLSLYVAGKSKPETALDRLVVLTWKGNKEKGTVGHSARCFSIPAWSPNLSGDDKDYLDILVDAVEQKQKLAAHKYVTEFLASNGGVCNDIPNEVVEPKTILAQFLSEEAGDDSSRGKLSAIQIGAWYEQSLAPLVMATVAGKQGWLEEGFQMSSEQEKTLKQTSNGYRAVLEKLAAPTPQVTIELAKQLKFAIDLLGEEGKDMVAKKLDRKIATILKPQEEVVSLANLM